MLWFWPEGASSYQRQNIYYNDEEIEYDEDIDELVVTSGVVNLSWKRRPEGPGNLEKKVKGPGADDRFVDGKNREIDEWIARNREKIGALLKPIVISLFNAEKTIKG